ncbi:MAG TPA: glucan biosynthesis protein [Methylococcus sp.]|nr:glucan biosynthesis protein [Methylococcus sp.]
MITRRELLWRLWGAAMGGALGSAGTRKVRADGEVGRPFSQAWLRTEARKLAAAPYRPPQGDLPAWLRGLDWDGYQSIRFRPGRSLWYGTGLPFQVRLFHLGLFFRHPVAIHEVVDGRAHPVRYAKDLFEFGSAIDVPSEPGELGFAGFRVHVAADGFDRDRFAFLGASYFRAVGETLQYGLSARGLAIDTGLEKPEEFPEFRSFWLERPTPGANSILVHALLDSPSVSGAYTFRVRPGATTVMDVEAWLYPRKTIERVGIAPVTSMFLHGENDRRVADDFRPEIHDSDGLSIRTGADEWIWRPLVNSPRPRLSGFSEESPRGFGLLQRDRNFDHYQDDGANYHLRPSLWVEPLEKWGRGAIQLVELPTADETSDNIVVFWSPEEGFAPGQERCFRYRLYWGSEPPLQSPAARVVATRIGWGGIPGHKDRPPPQASRKFVIDFADGPLADLPWETRVEPVVAASRGEIREPAARPVRTPGCRIWRANFDLTGTGVEPVDLRCYLRDERGPLTETWVYRWSPPS